HAREPIRPVTPIHPVTRRNTRHGGKRQQQPGSNTTASPATGAGPASAVLARSLYQPGGAVAQDAASRRTARGCRHRPRAGGGRAAAALSRTAGGAAGALAARRRLSTAG